jgi:hypothetical protein
MRKKRGNIYETPGIFHLESDLHANRPRFTRSQADLYETWLCGLTQIYGFDLLFWQFHATGFSIIVETSKATAPSNATLADGLAKIGETTLSNHLAAPEESPLIPHDTLRMERYLKHYHNLMEFAKGLKQRISRQHNQSTDAHGSIWADRMSVYRLPSVAHDLTEVAAFIFAYPQIHAQKVPSDWPGCYRSATKEGSIALRGLKRIFRNRQSQEANLGTLMERSAEIIQTVLSDKKKQAQSSGRRGRRPQWRPNCETPEYLETWGTSNDTTTYKKQAELAKRQFKAMFKRFIDFKKKTGYTAIPHGYQDDPELRTWASNQRGLYKTGRLPQWKIDLIQNSGVLNPPATGTRYVSSAGNLKITPQWMARYGELKSFYKDQGHSKLARTNQKHKTLANWVWIQRAKRRESQLLPEQIKLLDDVEFCWNPRARR